MYFHPDITVKRKYADAKVVNRNNVEQNFMPTEKITVSPFRLQKQRVRLQWNSVLDER
jgi:hypothetical protein